MRLTTILATLVIGLVTGCTESVTTSSGVFGDDTTVTRRSVLGQSYPAARETSLVRPGALARGNDRFINLNRTASQRDTQAIVSPRDNQFVDVSLVNASIEAAARAVLGDALGQSFTVSDDVQGTVTIQSTGPIPKDALLELFEAALAANGAMIEKQGSILKVVAGTSGNRTFRLATDGVGTGAHIIVARLEYISANQMVSLLDPLISEGLSAVADKRRNLLMMTGTSNQLEAALDALNLFDVDVLSGKSVALVQVNSSDPDAIVDELQTIFETEEGGSLNGVIEFIPNKRLGSVLIITTRARYLPRAQKWIRELDRTATGASKFIETYELQNRSAKEVAPILNELLDEVVPDEPANSSSSPTKSRVAADEARNALLVRATRSEHREIRGLLQQIDSSPQQVMLEATIAEVTLNDELSLGVRWFFENGRFDFAFSDAASGSAGGSFPGFSAVFRKNGDAMAINALAGVTEVKIISSPTLMVLDNEEAILQIGDQVPIATQSSTDTSSTNAPTITSIEYRDTGVILRVQPNISRTGRVVLDVTQEISSVASTQTSGIDSPTIRQRKIATNVLLNDGATLALGGLVQENDTKTVTRVPGLGDTPVLGALFRKTESSKRRSELLILIRPRVIETPNDAKTITEHWRAKLSGANSILETGLGSPTHTVSEMFE